MHLAKKGETRNNDSSVKPDNNWEQESVKGSFEMENRVGKGFVGILVLSHDKKIHKRPKRNKI